MNNLRAPIDPDHPIGYRAGLAAIPFLQAEANQLAKDIELLAARIQLFGHKAAITIASVAPSTGIASAYFSAIQVSLSPVEFDRAEALVIAMQADPDATVEASLRKIFMAGVRALADQSHD